MQTLSNIAQPLDVSVVWGGGVKCAVLQGYPEPFQWQVSADSAHPWPPEATAVALQAPQSLRNYQTFQEGSWIAAKANCNRGPVISFLWAPDLSFVK